MELDELEQWKALIKEEHRFYDTNRDKIMWLEAIEERDIILELCPEARDILGFIDRAHMKWEEGKITRAGYEYIKETRQVPPLKEPSAGGLEFWLCNKCGLILHCTDICPFCGSDCYSGKNFQYSYRPGEARLCSWHKKEIERGVL
jgi:rubrerythrin